MAFSAAPRKIVLTGGPGAGKTIAGKYLEKQLAPHAVYVPEAATQVYTRLGKKWDQLSIDQRRAAQTEMYRLQLQQESEAVAAASAAGVPLLILDRGTLDGAGYWPDGAEAFWAAMGTTAGAELGRYFAVLCLETAAALDLYDHDISNPVRFESPLEAIASGERMYDLWRAHPNLVRVGAYDDFDEKLAAVQSAVRLMVEKE